MAGTAAPHVTLSGASMVYTHIASGKFRRHMCKFSGLVSHRALEPGAVLRFEHFNRLQTVLTKLVARHLREASPGSNTPRAWRSSLAGVTQPLSGPAGLADHGKPRVSQLQSRCSQAAKYAP